MPFLKSLVAQIARKAAQDPRLREKAKQVFEEEIKPRAESAWQSAKPEVEAAWEKAKPEVEEAKRKALEKAGDLAGRVKRGIEARTAQRAASRSGGRDPRDPE